jgi:hypothetical protein
MKGQVQCSMGSDGQRVFSAIKARLDFHRFGHPSTMRPFRERDKKRNRLLGKIKEQFRPENYYALTDLNRKIHKFSLMTHSESWKRNKVTKLLGLFWVRCEPPEKRKHSE